MKSKSQKSRIFLSKDDLDIIKESVELWIKIDTEELKNKSYTIVDGILDDINYRYNDKKEEYTFNFDFFKLCKIHDTLADGVIYYKKDIKKIQPICERIEKVVCKNYGKLEVCYPIIGWKELIKTYKK